MIDAEDYYLVYICKTDKKKEVRARLIGTSHIAILDDGVSTTRTIAETRKLYRGSKENRKGKNKPKHAVLNMRKGFLCSKKYYEYLNGEEKFGT